MTTKTIANGDRHSTIEYGPWSLRGGHSTIEYGPWSLRGGHSAIEYGPRSLRGGFGGAPLSAPL